MTKRTLNIILIIGIIFCMYISMSAQITIYNNFGPDHDGWDYNYQMGWTVAGENVPTQFGIEQAMGFTSTETGTLSDIWVAMFSVPDAVSPDTVYVRLTLNTNGAYPDPADVLEEWMMTGFDSWNQWDPPIHIEGNGSTTIEQGESYWLWMTASDESNTGWCINIDPNLLCPHTIRREGEDWLNVSNESASAFRVDVGDGVVLDPPSNLAIESNFYEDFATFTWDAPIMDDLTGYEVYLDGVNQGNTIDQEWIFYGLENGTLYEAGVIAVYDEGTSEMVTMEFTFEGTGTNDLPIPNTALLNNYPNPFNPSTTISFSTTESTESTEIMIYNLKGQKIKTFPVILSAVEGSTGQHSVIWNGTDDSGKAVSSGVYFYKLKAGEYQETKKMILMK